MSFLTEIYSELDSEYEGQEKKTYLSAFYTLINYLELTDTGSGLNEQELKERFYNRTEYANIMQKLFQHNVLEQSEDGKFKLNAEAKNIMKPIFEDLMDLVYKPAKKISTKDPNLNLLYNCRSQIFSS